MKRLSLIIVLMITTIGFSQIHNPIKWSTSVKKISDTEYELIATANIENGWHLYSQTVAEGGPIPTTFTYNSNKNYLKKGNTKEDEGSTVNDKVFDMRIKYFDKKAEFKQRIKLKTEKSFTIEGTVEFMVCNDTNCLPPTEVDLIFNIK